MRKLISTIATFVLTSTSAMPLLACSSDDSLKIAFVPSNDSIEVMKIVKPLEGLLKNKIKELDPEFNRNVKITTTTDYEVAGQALQDGKTALAFLPMGTYTKYCGSALNPGNFAYAAPLVVAQRNAMIPEVDAGTLKQNNIDFAKQATIVQDYNTKSQGISDKTDAYNKLYSQTSDKKTASFYRSEILVNNKFLDREKNKSGIEINNLFTDEYSYKKNINTLITDAIAEGNDKIQLLKSNTSGAGVIYPVQWMLDNGIDRTVIAKILQQQARADYYTSAAQSVANDATDITFGYTDIRVDAEKVATDFANTKMIGVTKGIPNDGIYYSKKAIKDYKLLAAIREAFKELIESHKYDNIFSVYSHSDYLTPDKDATASAAASWEETQNNTYLAANKDIAQAREHNDVVYNIH